MQFKFDVCLHDTTVACKLYRMHVVRMMPSQLATRSTHLTEAKYTAFELQLRSCMQLFAENVQRGYFTSVAQPISFALFGLVGLFPVYGPNGAGA